MFLFLPQGKSLWGKKTLNGLLIGWPHCVCFHLGKMLKLFNKILRTILGSSKFSVEELLPIFSSFIFKDKCNQQRLFMPDSTRESWWWEGTMQSPSSSLPLTVGSTLTSDQFIQHFSRQQKASSKDRDSTASLGYMIQGLIVWIFFPLITSHSISIYDHCQRTKLLSWWLVSYLDCQEGL